MILLLIEITLFSKQISIDIDSTSLEIKEAYPDDSGAYSVLIRNQLGQARSSTQLFVKE